MDNNLKEFQLKYQYSTSNNNNKVKQHHITDHYRRSDGRRSKYRINIVMWDLNKVCPICDQNGTPKFYEVVPNQRLNGYFRNIKEPRAENQVLPNLQSRKSTSICDNDGVMV